MQLTDTDLLLTPTELYRLSGERLSLAYIKRAIHPQQGAAPWPHEVVHGEALVYLSGLPKQSRHKLTDPATGKPYTVERLREMAQNQQESYTNRLLLRKLLRLRYERKEDYRFYKQLRVGRKNTGLEEEKVVQLTRSAGVLDLFRSVRSKPEVTALQVGVSAKPELRALVAGLIAQEKEQGNKWAFYGLGNGSVSYLRKLESTVWGKLGENGREKCLLALVSGHYGNENGKIIGKSANRAGRLHEWHEAQMLGIYANFDRSRTLTPQEAYEQYLGECDVWRKQPVSKSAFSRFVEAKENQALLRRQRLGAKAMRDLDIPYVSSKPSRYSLSLLAADGETVGISYQRTLSNGRTVVRDRLWLVFVEDHHSRAIVGFDIGYTETGLGVRNALRMVNRNTQGRQAMQLLTDNGSAFLSAESRQAARAVARQHDTIQVGHSQQNPAEHIVNRLEKRFSKYEGWVGPNLSSKRKYAPNPDFFPKNSELMTEKEVIKAVYDEIQAHNQELMPDGRSRWQWFTEDVNPACGRIDELQQRFAFWLRSQPKRVNRGEVAVELWDGSRKLETRLYYAPDWRELQKQVPVSNKGKVVVYYDEETPEFIDLYNYTDPTDPAGDSYLMTMEAKPRTAKGVAEQDAESLAALGKAKAAKERYLKQVTEEEAALWESYESLLAEKAELAEVEIGLPFRNTAHKGQHKAPYADAEAAYFERMYQETEQHRKRQPVLVEATVQDAKSRHQAMIDAKFERLKNGI